MRVLVVDDEKAILDIFEEYLEMCGHVPIIASNGRLALDYYMEEPDAFDLILTDINMPIVDGIELAYRIRAVRPLAPIIFISACLEEEIWKDICHLQPCKWLKKPFQLEQLDQFIDAYQPSVFAQQTFENIIL